MANEPGAPSSPLPSAVQSGPTVSHESEKTTIEAAETVKDVATVEKSPATAQKSSGSEAEPSKEEAGAEASAADAPTTAVEAETESAGNAPVKAGGENNGTPASSNKNKRKSSSGVPEHKQKKLNKKKSQKLTHLDAAPGDYFFARLKGHAPWPSIICDEEMLPVSLLSTRPVTAKRADGTYRDDFADGGRRATERTFPIMYLETNEFGWISNQDLHEIDLDTVGEQSEKGKSKALYRAYQVAAEKHDLDYFKGLLQEHEAALQAEAEAYAEAQAAKAKGKGKKKGKSTTAASDEDIEMEDVGAAASDADGDEDDAGAESKSKSKKRKKDIDSDGENDTPKKTPKRANSTKKSTPKLKLSKPKTPNGTEKTPSSAKAAKTAKPKSSGKKARATKTESANAEADEAKAEEKPLSAEEQYEKKHKELLYVRHRLQKGFLTRDGPPKEEDMKTMSDYIAKLESYADLEVSLIRSTKVHKVLKALLKLNTIPRDEEFNFRQRSHTLIQTWSHSLAGDAEPGEKDDAAATNTTSTNGVAAKKLSSAVVDGAEKAVDKAVEVGAGALDAAKDGIETVAKSVADAVVRGEAGDEEEADKTEAKDEKKKKTAADDDDDDDVAAAPAAKAKAGIEKEVEAGTDEAAKEDEDEGAKTAEQAKVVETTA